MIEKILDKIRDLKQKYNFTDNDYAYMVLNPQDIDEITENPNDKEEIRIMVLLSFYVFFIRQFIYNPYVSYISYQILEVLSQTENSKFSLEEDLFYVINNDNVNRISWPKRFTRSFLILNEITVCENIMLNISSVNLERLIYDSYHEYCEDKEHDELKKYFATFIEDQDYC